ncbi:hypothetical protein BDV96DRAFT_652090 [Lophiotrema nucula]|uniref:F-box domain-containing protein n=1 Tax=Lophiotrema nucula TaxID=690887 RepID=A0A6A5YQ23_9PLEO|nr:hypothetical protein BDV96DRAFT_652090 [Lophiotrema nucula]
MTTSLLNLPPELLVNILSFLPIPALLKFSETCHCSHGLANSSLHTLSLGIHPTRVSGIISRLAATQYASPKLIGSAFSLPNQSSNSILYDRAGTYDKRRNFSTSELLSSNDPYKVSVLIPDSQVFEYVTLLSFHTALTKSILLRHGGTLRNLDLSLWTLTKPIAKALSNLTAVRALSIRIEEFPHVRAVPRSRIARQRVHEREAWDVLTSQAIWAPRVTALRLEGGELDTAQLTTLLSKSRWCRELWVCKCPGVGKEVWSFLANEWEGRTALKILGVMKCGSQLDEAVLEMIGELKGLQFLTLHGCRGLDSDVVEEWNRDVWKIPEVIPPFTMVKHIDPSTIIEVDPAYLISND